MKYTLKPGTRLQHFVIKKLIGIGGMGAVYLAEDTSLSRDVAIKTLHIAPEDYVNNIDRVKRFIEEAKVLAQLSSPNITIIHYISKVDDEIPFIVMELLKGETLKQYSKKKTINLNFALKVLIEVSDALEMVHEKGIVHRDIKPGNLFLTKNGEIKILDFGIAKWDNEQSLVRTKTNQLVGSVDYLPPEVFTGKKSHKTIDVYALGITIMNLMTEEDIMLNDTTTIEISMHDELRHPRLPKEMERELPREFIDLLYDMVKEDPDQRPQSMKEIHFRSTGILEEKPKLKLKDLNIVHKDDFRSSKKKDERKKNKKIGLGRKNKLDQIEDQKTEKEFPMQFIAGVIIFFLLLFGKYSFDKLNSANQKQSRKASSLPIGANSKNKKGPEGP